MNKETQTPQAAAQTSQVQSPQNDFLGRIQMAIRKTSETNRPFFVLILHIENFQEFKNKREPHVVNGFARELYSAVRMAVHPSQYVGVFDMGLGLVFDAVDPGKVDTIARRLVSLTQNVIRTGHYNDLTSRWTDILQQFLWPNNPGLLFARVGWAVYPRDGNSPQDLITRARRHVAEMATR